ncbi:hypothetical protein B0H63DRAFT_255643 [Podospora didyma]|uniref:Uncharacterized protein n=1 Tax=Podospora didyma TaxID=330526 RepID=A0AAE0KDU3_9PEZI|nr:hypothetical protein B0H63DRAFT_255643 [Podospora didyma]
MVKHARQAVAKDAAPAVANEADSTTAVLRTKKSTTRSPSTARADDSIPPAIDADMGDMIDPYDSTMSTRNLQTIMPIRSPHDAQRDLVTPILEAVLTRVENFESVAQHEVRETLGHILLLKENLDSREAELGPNDVANRVMLGVCQVQVKNLRLGLENITKMGTPTTELQGMLYILNNHKPAPAVVGGPYQACRCCADLLADAILIGDRFFTIDEIAKLRKFREFIHARFQRIFQILTSKDWEHSLPYVSAMLRKLSYTFSNSAKLPLF